MQLSSLWRRRSRVGRRVGCRRRRWRRWRRPAAGRRWRHRSFALEPFKLGTSSLAPNQNFVSEHLFSAKTICVNQVLPETDQTQIFVNKKFIPVSFKTSKSCVIAALVGAVVPVRTICVRRWRRRRRRHQRQRRRLRRRRDQLLSRKPRDSEKSDGLRTKASDRLSIEASKLRWKDFVGLRCFSAPTGLSLSLRSRCERDQTSLRVETAKIINITDQDQLHMMIWWDANASLLSIDKYLKFWFSLAIKYQNRYSQIKICGSSIIVSFIFVFSLLQLTDRHIGNFWMLFGGFEPCISGVGSNRFANCANITTLVN